MSQDILGLKGKHAVVWTNTFLMQSNGEGGPGTASQVRWPK